ncbi:uroporphyrinogen-III synthase [Niveispirillum irakense]|uniref:uroporphyrinogen-III synthase n=1 Tax=Niveispirillum irakense TaxID=34011 RepID=UPI00041FC708|nr:uroporphyrinogen-III synthase [Niveispirillum irakense]
MTGILVTRPEPAASETTAFLAARGYSVHSCPLLEVEGVLTPPPDLAGVAALVLTSPNGVRALEGLIGQRDLPVYAVGDRTADMALAAGFASVRSAGGDIHDLARLILTEPPASEGRLLHICGADVAGDLASLLRPGNLQVERHVAYRAVPVRHLDAGTVAALAAGDITHVLLFSARTARAFVTLACQAEMVEAVHGLTALCISNAVAEAASGLSWRRVEIAASPDADSLLALLPPAP